MQNTPLLMEIFNLSSLSCFFQFSDLGCWELQGDPVYLESGTEKTERPQQGASHPLIPPQIHVFPYEVLYKVIL